VPNIGLPELFLVLLIVLLLFGPGHLPKAGAALGQAVRELRQGLQEEEKRPTPEEPDRQPDNPIK